MSSSDVYSSNNETNPSEVREKPLIKLPQNPQIPLNTKRLNPQYNYKTIGEIKDIGDPAKWEQANLFAVVHDIYKPLTVIPRNKFTIICQIIDESGSLFLHFFTSEDAVIKQIEKGDVLRLHRVKLELFNGAIDGRVFFSHDIMLFKKNSRDIKPLTTAKKIHFPNEEVERVEKLKQWHKEEINRVTLLGSIVQPGKYNIVCKVVSEPQQSENVVKVVITDGSLTNNFMPSFPLNQNKKEIKSTNNIATEIMSYTLLQKYNKLKVGDYVHFYDVEAAWSDSEKKCFHLSIKTDIIPFLLERKNDIVDDIERRIRNIDCHVVPMETISCSTKNSNIKAAIDNFQVQGRRFLPRRKKNKTEADQNSSCTKTTRNGIESVKNDLIDNNAENAYQKTRKPLFTPNYATDLSDATDDTSDNLEIQSRDKLKRGPDEVIAPADTSLGDIMEKVKTMYCSTKKQDHLNTNQSPENAQNESIGRNTRSRKRTLETSSSDLQDTSRDFNAKSDASTVVNVSYRQKITRDTHGKSNRSRLGSDSSNQDQLDERNIDLGASPVKKKVSSWLFNPHNNPEVGIETSELDIMVLKQILCGQPDDTDISRYITNVARRMKVFLLEVIPDPSLEPKDLISGYCYSGCQQIFLFSKIRKHSEELKPLCPDCYKIEQEKELLLMFMLELHVMDLNGCHSILLVCREHGEIFFNCSVSEFLMDKTIRSSRIQLLTDYMMQTTYRSAVTPMMDLSVALLKNMLCVVSSTLVLPPTL